MILFSSFGDKEFYKYHIDYYIKKKILIEIWTISKFNNKKNLRNFKVRYFSKLKLLLREIQSTNDKKIVFDILFCLNNFKSYRVYKTLSLCDSIYITHPINYNTENIQSHFNLNKYFNLRNYYLKFTSYLFSLFIKNINLKLKSANYFYIRTRKEIQWNKNNLLVSKNTKILWGHYSDYFTFIKNKKKIKKKNYIVFIDQNVPNHTDLLGYNDVDFGKYYSSILKFLNNLNLTLRKKIHICLHPRSNFQKMQKYLSADCSVGKTYEMVRKSYLVVSHDSVAITFAILLKKPLILITNNELNNSSYPHLKEIKSLAARLRKNVINIDQDINYDFLIKKEMHVSFKNYGHFIKNFIKFKGEDVSRAELIFKSLVDHRIWK